MKPVMILFNKLWLLARVWSTEVLAQLIIFPVTVQVFQQGSRKCVLALRTHIYMYVCTYIGVLTAIPWELFEDIVDPKVVLNGDGSTATAVGMMFLPRYESINRWT